MQYYQEITLLPDNEISSHFLWQKCYQQLHIALVNQKDTNGHSRIGISFPEYDQQLGRKLRLFANSKTELEALDIPSYLSRLTDYLHFMRARPIPDNKIQSYAIFKRIQNKTNPERIARRKAKREGISYQQALDFLKGRQQPHYKLPYIHIKSASTGQTYPLLIQRIKAAEAKPNCIFNSYGLSINSPLPLF